jgi:hypothetical protein
VEPSHLKGSEAGSLCHLCSGILVNVLLPLRAPWTWPDAGLLFSISSDLSFWSNFPKKATTLLVCRNSQTDLDLDKVLTRDR